MITESHVKLIGLFVMVVALLALCYMLLQSFRVPVPPVVGRRACDTVLSEQIDAPSRPTSSTHRRTRRGKRKMKSSNISLRTVSKIPTPDPVNPSDTRDGVPMSHHIRKEQCCV